MKRLFLAFALVVGAFGVAMAQKSVTGVITDQSGEPLIGASILVKGTTTGTVTDIDGTYNVTVPAGATTLVVSYTGFETTEVEVGTQTVLNLTLSEGITLTEAVVTSLGITREKKSLSYAVQEVDQKDLNISRSSGLINALSGKAAGVQLVGSPSAGFREGSIRIRGVNGITGSDPLYVLDGTPVSASAVNLDNVESVSVLKGPAATALYGNRASGGVVVITSKKGAKGSGLGIDVNSSSTFDNVNLLPEYQNEYGGGYDQEFIQFSYNPAIHPASWAAFDGQNIIDYSADESWGPRLDGTPYRPYYSWYEGTPDFGKEVPFAPQPNNVRDFFETGMNLNNNVAFYGGGDDYSFRINYNNITRELVLPNTRQEKNFLSVNGNFDLSKLITVSANVNYQHTYQKGNILEGYGAGLTGSFNQWFQRQTVIEKLRNYKNADGSFNSWNISSPEDTRPLYWDNPYYDLYENAPHYYENRLYGNFGITLNLMEHLKLQGFIRTDLLDYRNDSRFTEGGLGTPFYATGKGNRNEMNYEALLSYDGVAGKVSYDFNLGANIRRNNNEAYAASTVGGLAIPGFYNIGNSIDKPNVSDLVSEKEVRSVYGRGPLGYDNMLYLEFSVRNDWSSALPQDNNSYLYPMIGASFVFSELMNSKVFSFGKVRYSFAQVGSDIDAFQINTVYSAPSNTFYGSLPAMAVPNTLRNAELKPALTSTHEAGLEMKFLNNRVGFDFTYYRDDNRDQILNLTVPPTSGFGTAIINAGNISRQGVEVQLTGTPIKTRDFNWDITLNWAKNESVVEELADGLDTRVIGGSGFEGGPFWRGISVHARVGEEWGTVVGRAYRRDANGNRLVGENGLFLYDENVELGSILPDFTGGLINQIRFKNFRLSAAIDFQKGGQYYSVTRMFNAYSGLAAETVGLNDRGGNKRDDPADGGGVRSDGLLANGQPSDIYLSADTYYKQFFGLGEEWMTDATYLKLREVAIGYSFDTQKLGLKFIKRLDVSVVGRNLALMFTKVKGFDPSETERYWYEGGQLPQTRAFGFNIGLSF